MALFKKRREPTEMTLHEAVARGLVSVELFGVGEGLVSEARLCMTKHLPGPLRVRIPRGTSFTPVEPEVDLDPAGTAS